MKKIKVVYLEHCTDATVGGSHYCLLEICRALDKQMYDASVIFYQENDLIPEFRETGFTVRIEAPFVPVRLAQNMPSIIGKLARVPVNYYRMMILRVLYWRKILREEKADILHLNNTFSIDHDALIAAKSLGIPVVSHVRGIEVKINKVSRILSRYIDKIIAISKAVNQNLSKNSISDKNIRLIYDGIKESRITDGVKERFLFSEYDLKPGHIVMGVVGNVKSWKGQRLLVEAASLLKQKYAKFYCFLVGNTSDQAYYNELVNLIETEGLQDHIIITGYQKNIPDFVNSFDIFVHTSIEPEPFGIVILEAMALKKPVIVSNIGAPQEIIEDGVSGLLFDVKQASDLADKISLLIQDVEKRESLGVNGYKRFRGNFTIDINVKAICDVYREVTRN